MIVLFAGLPGVGKTTLSKKIVHLTNWDYLNKDYIRDAIFPTDVLDYSDKQNEIAANTMQEVAHYIVSKDPKRIILIDGRPFRKKSHITDYYNITNKIGKPLCIIHCVAPDEVLLQRLENDPGPLAAQRNWNKIVKMKEEFEPITFPHLKLNMDNNLDELAQRCIKYIQSLVVL